MLTLQDSSNAPMLLPGIAVKISIAEFADLWKAAIAQYEQDTGRKLAYQRLAKPLLACNSAEDVLRVLRERGRRFTSFRGHEEKIRAVLKPVAHFVALFADAAAEAAASTTPGGKAIFIAFGVLLKATRGVSEIYDALQDLSLKISRFLDRIQLYVTAKSTPIQAMNNVLIDTLAETLKILGLFTKYLDEDAQERSVVKRFASRLTHRLEDFGQVLLGKGDVQNALKRFDQLTAEEHLTAAVATFAVVVNTDLNIAQLLRREVRKEIKAWLNPPQWAQKYNDKREQKFEGTCEWFFDENFDDWTMRKNSLYWIYGNPGSGKSVLCSAILDKLLPQNQSLLTYFYFDASTPDKQTVAGLFSSLIFQLSAQSEVCNVILQKLYDEPGASHHSPTRKTLYTCLEKMLRTCGSVIVVLDALDECAELSEKSGLLALLQPLRDPNFQDLRLLVSSRPEDSIVRAMEAATHKLDLNAAVDHGTDLLRYIEHELTQPPFSSWPNETKSMIARFLSQNANGMFLWVNLQLISLRSNIPADARKVIHEMPTSLNSTYHRILSVIRQSKAKEARARLVFECIAFSTRNLLLTEIAEILAAEFTSSGEVVLNTTFRDEEDEVKLALFRLCGGFLQIIDKGQEYQVVQFVHASAQEYLLSDAFGLNPSSAHATLAGLCLSSLLSSLPSSQLAFHSYAICNWHEHIDPENLADGTSRYLSTFLSSRSKAFLEWQRLCGFEFEAVPSLIYWASYVGFIAAIKADPPDLLDTLSFNTRGGPLGTALCAAAFKGRDKVTDFLLAHNASVQVLGRSMRSPLDFAVENGNLTVTGQLLEHGCALETRDEAGFIPLLTAAYFGHLEVVRTLLDRGASVNAPNNNGATSLYIAAQNGHLEVVRTLLGCGANIHAPVNGGFTPLYTAAGNGHLEVVRTLLDRGASIDAPNNNGATPLYIAAQNGYLEVVHTFLGRGANIYAPVNGGFTPLYIAAGNGHLEVVRTLLNRGASVDAPDNNGVTPLYIAAENGHLEVVRMLLDHGANVDAPKEESAIALYDTAQNKHVEASVPVTRALLDRIPGMNTRPSNATTVLYAAARSGNTMIAKILLDYGADVNGRGGRDNWTAFHGACEDNHLNVVKMLIRRDADPGICDSTGCAPMHFAAYSGSVEIARYLLDELSMDVNARTDDGQTPLHLAAEYGFDAASVFLMKRRADAWVRSKAGWTALHYAAFRGHTAVISSLIERGVSLAMSDNDGLRALDYAVIGGHADVVRLLLDHCTSVESTSSIYGSYVDLASRALRADSTRPVTRTWRLSESQEVAELFEDYHERCAKAVRGERRLRRVRSCWY